MPTLATSAAGERLATKYEFARLLRTGAAFAEHDVPTSNPA